MKKNYEKAQSAEKILKSYSQKKKAEIFKMFFKTAPGQYGHGDKFIGVTVPQIRGVAKEFKDLTFTEIKKLLKSPIHEVRSLGTIILTNQSKIAIKKNDQSALNKIKQFYISNRSSFNNWDLVDISAEHTLGAFYFFNKNKCNELIKMSASNSLWTRRMSIIATFYFIRRNEFELTLKISKSLLHDKEDLMHKAVGWMLREVGKRDLNTLLHFLEEHTKKMPRTMLRYAIEKLPESKRQYYLKL